MTGAYQPQPIGVVFAPPIAEASWLNRPEYEEFRAAYAYAMTQTRGILAMQGVSPEDAYWIWLLIERGRSRNAKSEATP